MSKNIIYVKHCAEEVVTDLGLDMTLWKWHSLNEIRPDPSVSYDDFWRVEDK